MEEDYHYHLYSWDDSGRWSHKKGIHKIEKMSRKISCTDDFLTASCNRFVGFYLVPQEGIDYFPTLKHFELKLAGVS